MAGRHKLEKVEPGVFYRKHPTRKHGGNFDRQWIVRQVIDGKERLSTIGWWSDGVKQGDASNKAAEYKSNHKWNKANPDQPPRPICRQDEDGAAAELAARLERERKQTERKNITFGEYFKTRYLPKQYDDGKDSANKEEQMFRLHIEPVVGRFTFPEIMPFHIEKIGKSMKAKKLAPSTVLKAYAFTRQAWNLANVDGITDKVHPVKHVKKPKINNERERFFTDEEERLLLTELLKRSPITYDMATMSVDTGARWGELADLKWGHVDLETGTARLIDTKAGDNRTIFITERVKEILNQRKQAAQSKYVFPAVDGGRQKQVNVVFERTVEALGFNDDVEVIDGKKDARYTLCFHSLRHTFASRLTNRGISRDVIQKLMGHHDPKMTQRYSHLESSTLRAAVAVLEKQPDSVIRLSDRKTS